MKIENLRGKRILIVGFGLEGKATYRFLAHVLAGQTVDVTDQTEAADYLQKQYEYDLVIKTPGIPGHMIHVPYTTATNIFFANVRGKTIGVTGSKGKSTTASLLFAMLKQARKPVYLGGNIGVPLLDILREHNESDAYYVCELSSYQLEDIEYSPHISLLTNIFPEHMDYHGNEKKYYEAKKRIVAYATSRDYYVYNPVYPQLVMLASQTSARGISFVSSLPISDDEIPLLGQHNKDNIRGATTVAKLVGVQDDAIRSAISSFRALAHRLERVGTFGGITFYDDAISTTPQSTIAALRAIPGVKTIFLGGQNRGYDFTPLIEELEHHYIPNVVLFPNSGADIRREALRRGVTFARVCETRSMKEAVAFAYANTPKGSVCLLSTASPSYSVWKNFEAKGNEFQRQVKALGKKI